MCQLLLVTSEMTAAGYTYSAPENIVESSPKCTEAVLPASATYVKLVMSETGGGHITPSFPANAPPPAPPVPAPDPPVPAAVPPVPFLASWVVQAASPAPMQSIARRDREM